MYLKVRKSKVPTRLELVISCCPYYATYVYISKLVYILYTYRPYMIQCSAVTPNIYLISSCYTLLTTEKYNVTTFTLKEAEKAI